MTKTNPTKDSKNKEKYKSLHRSNSGKFERTEKLNLKCRFCGSNNIVGFGYIIAWPNLVKTCTFIKEYVNERTCFHPPEIKGQPSRYIPKMKTGGCLADDIISGDEARFWLESKTLEEYFTKWSDALDKGIVLVERKLSEDI